MRQLQPCQPHDRRVQEESAVLDVRLDWLFAAFTAESRAMISADCRMGGFHENRLIRCVREREKEIRTKHVVDRWFLTRFSIENAYAGLCEEFFSLDGGPSAWEAQNGKGNPFIATPLGGNTLRQLKVSFRSSCDAYLARESVFADGQD
ncbi:unnamed protein product [Heligmosomoides polygyrus]|uniref:Uncharacterized protein n=1 Tax=Heligmosomoides polygyrus TaxID=6339 RepID=A0A3P7W479_HELPZ|nr:unnamed protein product [Heligmosomoides polygyrus]